MSNGSRVAQAEAPVALAFLRVLPITAALAALVACGSRAGSAAAGPPASQGVAVEVRPARVSLVPGGTVDFTSVVTGTADPSVGWEVIETGGGSVSAAGTYTAPLAIGDYTVRAVSRASAGALGTAKVRVGHVAVAVSPSAATVGAGGALAVTAQVTGTKDDSVSWSIREPSGCGTVSPSGQYTAPASAAVCHVDVTSTADPSAVAEATATVTAPPAPTPTPPAPVSVTITPASATADACRTLAFTATVSGTSNGAVTWTIQEGSAGGTIAADGIYTAPATAGTYHVVASSQESPGSSAVAAVTVADRILGVTVSPATAMLAPGGTAVFTATVTTTCGTVTSAKLVAAPN